MPLTGNISSDIHEMSHSPNHRKRVKKYGRKKAHQMEVAAAARTHDEKTRKKKGRMKSHRHKGRRRR